MAASCAVFTPTPISFLSVTFLFPPKFGMGMAKGVLGRIYEA